MKHKLELLNFRIKKVFQSHQAFVVVMILLIVSLAVVLRIRQLDNKPADQAYIEENSLSLKSVNFNQKAIEQIETLRDSNVAAPGTQLPGNRQNPFSE